MYRRSPGRRDGRPFGNDHGPGPDFDSEWRVPEMHGPPHWDDGPNPREGPEGDWGRPGRDDFRPPQRDRRSRSIEDYKGRRSPADYHHHRSGPDPPSGYLERRRLSPSKNFHEEMRPRSPRRRGSRDNAPSPLTFEHGHRHSSPGGWGRDGHGVDHPDRQEVGLGRGAQGPRGYSPRGREFSRPHDRRQQDRMERGRSYQEEHNQAAYRERSPFSDRSQQSKRSEFRDHRPPEKRPRDSWSHYEEEEQEEGSERPYIRSGAPLIVEHDHGISHHEGGGGDRDGRERHQAPHRHHGGPPPPDRHRRHEARDEPPMEPHAKRRRTTPPPPLMSLPRRQPPEHGGGERDVPTLFQKRQAGPPPAPAQDVDLRPDRTDRGGGSAAFSGKKWEQKDNHHQHQQQQQRRKGGPDMGPQRPPFHPHRDSSQGKHSNRDMPSTSRADPSERETLKIRVDMSRPMGQDRYGLANSNILSGSLGYSSDRQLSLDLVNVGRQRLDFLPMLEHSGTFRETPLHTGTFAQEIITLVHQVKEMYFKGYNTTLNERFSSVMTDGPEPDEDAVADRRIKVSVPESMPLFSKIGNPEPQRRPQAFDPGDLRHDLERRRQERLEGVKITISGASFPPMPDSVENEMMFEEDEREMEREREREREMGFEDGPPPHWDDEGPGDRRDWGEQPNDMRHRMPWSGRRNRRRAFRSGPQSGPNRRQYHNSANGGDW